MTSKAWRILFIVVGVALLVVMAYAHDVLPGWELILGIVLGALLLVAGLRGRVL
jgi:hypothetical protein